MAINKGIITAFSLLVGCGVIAAASLLYMSKKDLNGSGNENENENENGNGKDFVNKGIKKIEEIFNKHEKNDDNNEMKDSIINQFKVHLDLDKAINEANKFFNDNDESKNENKNNNRTNSSDSDISFSSSISTLGVGGKKTKRHKKLKSKTRFKKSKSKSKPKIYKKLI
jgi:hypothetical protein